MKTKIKKIGSATVAIVVVAMVFMLYATSTYADVRHLKNKYNEYEHDIIQIYKIDYNNKIQEL